jgi:hypothetical protein
MVIEWRECKHEENDSDSLEDPNNGSDLRQCKLLKYFHITTMTMQCELLHMLIGYWGPD